jgi:transposase
MSETFAAAIPAAVDYQTTLILSIEVSNKSWVLAAQVPGHTKASSVSLGAEALLTAISGYRARAADLGHKIERMPGLCVCLLGWNWCSRKSLSWSQA